MSKCSEQFDVLSNALRILPEEAARLDYLCNKVNDPEEGISNIEIASVNVLNQFYGMMLNLKEDGILSSIYEDDAINTILCIRHVLQHQSGRIKNTLRDSFNSALPQNVALINYSVSGEPMTDFPFYLNLGWMNDQIGKSNNAKKLVGIKTKWNLDKIEADLSKENLDADCIYINIMAFITEATRQLCKLYGAHFQPNGYDSRVYYSHFSSIDEVETNNYVITKFDGTRT
ncbi:hypothetical protein [Vibrio cholerae]|uniref:hypothetical protein n=1 Tax=Vibrio cholerae TaxID=666 RepID=UPI001A9E8312|nr:hypothetical protein [Vibrio cholerae]MBO1368153.1 hypothetical protein [Vibrio cholerae]MBO1371909.1 hypothetical protein [Vibrio cholerae]MBO1375622.1 hypothetical protein [Vibrio cholerae]MBO1379345.1 hypothetical protein [Vibrio cholerae]MBO1409191.1 hypothetical protein [Vibrio cholerae]